MQRSERRLIQRANAIVQIRWRVGRYCGASVAERERNLTPRRYKAQTRKMKLTKMTKYVDRQIVSPKQILKFFRQCFLRLVPQTPVLHFRYFHDGKPRKSLTILDFKSIEDTQVCLIVNVFLNTDTNHFPSIILSTRLSKPDHTYWNGKMEKKLNKIRFFTINLIFFNHNFWP